MANAATSMQRQLGSVTRLVTNRGYGFARGEVDRVAYFFHASEVDDFDALNARCVARQYREQRDGSLVLADITQAVRVAFTPSARAERGPRAVDIQLVSS